MRQPSDQAAKAALSDVPTLLPFAACVFEMRPQPPAECVGLLLISYCCQLLLRVLLTGVKLYFMHTRQLPLLFTQQPCHQRNDPHNITEPTEPASQSECCAGSAGSSSQQPAGGAHAVSHMRLAVMMKHRPSGRATAIHQHSDMNNGRQQPH